MALMADGEKEQHCAHLMHVLLKFAFALTVGSKVHSHNSQRLL